MYKNNKQANQSNSDLHQSNQQSKEDNSKKTVKPLYEVVRSNDKAKKFKTTVEIAGGESKEISVWIDIVTASVLETCGNEEIIRQYIIDEYEERLNDRKETRRSISLSKSMDNGFDIADPNVNMEANAIKAEDLQKLHKAIGSLEPQQQWLIEQIYFCGRSYVEIAQELGVGESAIRSRLKKIYEKIKKFLN